MRISDTNKAWVLLPQGRVYHRNTPRKRMNCNRHRREECTMSSENYRTMVIFDDDLPQVLLQW